MLSASVDMPVCKLRYELFVLFPFFFFFPLLTSLVVVLLCYLYIVLLLFEKEILFFMKVENFECLCDLFGCWRW